MTRKTILIAAFCTVLLGAGNIPGVRAENTAGTQATLQGIQGVGVVVATDFDDRNLERFGLSGVQIQADVDLRLKMGRIKTVSTEEEALSKGLPLLQVSVMARKAKGAGGYSYAVYVELLQPVVLAANPSSRPLLAPTWSSAYAIDYARSNELRRIREVMKMEVSKFVDAVKAANPVT